MAAGQAARLLRRAARASWPALPKCSGGVLGRVPAPACWRPPRAGWMHQRSTSSSAGGGQAGDGSEPVCAAASDGSACAGASDADTQKDKQMQEDTLRRQVAQGTLPGTTAEEAYALAFTCTVCNTRSAKRISKRAYLHGVVIITCPSCQNRHLIADRLKWFQDDETDIVKIMREKGEEAVMLSQYRLAGKNKVIEPLVQVEGLDLGELASPPRPSAAAPSWPPLEPVPELPDDRTLAAVAEAAS